MSELITDEMVEAATVASINVSLAPYAESITTTTDLQGGGEALAEMRAALEVAAPLIAAQALWDAAEAFGENQTIREGDVKEWLRDRAKLTEWRSHEFHY